MNTLHFMEAFGIDKLPGPENVYLMRPNGPDVIEAEREIEEKKGFWVYDPKFISLAARALYAKPSTTLRGPSLTTLEQIPHAISLSFFCHARRKIGPCLLFSRN